jgi:hypothetical protein
MAQAAWQPNAMSKPARKRMSGTAGCLALGMLLTGCVGSTVAVKIDSAVPQALVSRLPVAIGVYYDNAFSQHVYREASEDRENWTIDTGASQVKTFNTVLESMFTRVQPVGQAPAAGVDAVLVPAIEDIQFATPGETRLEFFEAWIKYRVKLIGSDGGVIADWVFSAYGKSPKELFTRAGEGLQNAMGVALRDAGAKLATGLPEVPEVKAWLQAHGAPAPTPTPAGGQT